jgi:hypothetical protein
MRFRTSVESVGQDGILRADCQSAQTCYQLALGRLTIGLQDAILPHRLT